MKSPNSMPRSTDLPSRSRPFSLQRSAFSLSLSAFSLFLAGCNLPTITPPQADAVRHFTLSTPAGVLAGPDAPRVKPVELAGHLRNRALAVRVAENEVIYLEEARWAESLDDAITQLLRARLGAAGGGCTVEVQVLRCELVRYEGNTVQLAATYVVTPDDTLVAPKRGIFNSTPRTWEGRDHGVLVAHLRDAINELGDALVTQVSGMPRTARK